MSTRSRGSVDIEKLREREKTWFGIVVVLLVVLLFATIFFTPYGRGEASPGSQIEPIQAIQFGWIIPPRPLHVGRPVEFRLTSADVNHGFAVFSPQDVFLFQVQVIPTKVQLYNYTFTEPGTYTIECFEYCGVGHDQMLGKFRVIR
jgi:cytochrome c oxidase subunit II